MVEQGPMRREDETTSVDDALRAVADGTRRAILRLVDTRERTVGDIAANFEMSRPAISQHLRVLRDAGLVDVRPDGNRRLYRARSEGLEGARAALDDLWGNRLTRLARAAEQEDWPARARADNTDKADP